MRRPVLSMAVIGIALASFRAEARLGNLPEYPWLEKAEVVALFDTGNAHTSLQKSGVSPSFLCEIDSPKFLRGSSKDGLSYESEECGTPGNSRTSMVFLSRGEKGLTPVNWMGSTIPSSLEFSELKAVHGDCWDVLRAMFLKESHPDFALFQARVIATAPREFSRTCVRPTKSEDDRLWLARFLVSLYGEGAEALDPSRGPFPDISKIGVSESGVNTLSLSAGASVGTWFRENASTKNASQLLDFALQQKGAVQADMIHGIAKFVPLDRMGDIARLMATSRDNRVRYACFKSVNYRLNDGKGICGSDDFSRNPKRHLARAQAVLDAGGIAATKATGK